MSNIISPILRPKQAAHYMGVSLPTFWRIAKQDNTFPSLFKLSPNATALMRAELDQWINSKKGVQ